MDRDAGGWVTAVATLVLVAAACSGSDGDGSDPLVSSSTTTAAVAGDAATTQAPAATGQSGLADYSVLMLANVDELTATSTLESLEAAGITGFVMRGSAEEGFDLYRPGLTNPQALDVITEIFASPDVNGGLIFETANLP
ncbi:hypothetical protein MNBD_ACTINO02-265 [hydrothermal vent metagenome]|uniref:Uncharacterized protein n=1 Tax=hydrothermal vent metagenome TaxID=652676 RepID=A0A3B0T1G2_9ZZZZ